MPAAVAEDLPIFARLRRAGFDCECPGCGRMAIVRPGSADAKAFDDRTGRWRCRCGRQYLIGLNFVPLAKGQPATRLPPDTLPSRRQAAVLEAAELRAMQASRLRVARMHAGRVNTGPACLCAARWGGGVPGKGRNPACPRHGELGGGQDG